MASGQHLARSVSVWHCIERHPYQPRPTAPDHFSTSGAVFSANVAPLRQSRPPQAKATATVATPFSRGVARSSPRHPVSHRAVTSCQCMAGPMSCRPMPGTSPSRTRHPTGSHVALGGHCQVSPGGSVQPGPGIGRQDRRAPGGKGGGDRASARQVRGLRVQTAGLVAGNALRQADRLWDTQNPAKTVTGCPRQHPAWRIAAFAVLTCIKIAA